MRFRSWNSGYNPDRRRLSMSIDRADGKVMGSNDYGDPGAVIHRQIMGQQLRLRIAR